MPSTRYDKGSRKKSVENSTIGGFPNKLEKLIFIHASSRNYHIANIRMYVLVYELELNKLCPRCKRSSPRLYLKTRECRSQSNPAPVPRPRDSTHDFNTQSGGALRLPFLDSERRSESIFGIQSAPPLSSYIWC